MCIVSPIPARVQVFFLDSFSGRIPALLFDEPPPTFHEEPGERMKVKAFLALILAGAALGAAIALFHPASQPGSGEPLPADTAPSSRRAERPPLPANPGTARKPGTLSQAAAETTAAQSPAAPVATSVDKLERLTQIRESFRNLAAGDSTAALRTAKGIADENERETALLTLVTEWTQGNLRPPAQRASAVFQYGLETGLGLELTSRPDLAVLWANEMTDLPGRAAILQQTATALLDSDPAAAFALGNSLPQAERPKFLDAVYAGWGSKDTDAALRWADQLSDPVEREPALAAIRSVAPVGIGAALSVQDGYPVINQVFPGTPAELSGQLHQGDRILALAQGNNPFVDVRSLSLQDIVQMVRGAPGTLLQLQVLSADAPPNSQPQTVPIVRDQIKFKRSSP